MLLSEALVRLPRCEFYSRYSVPFFMEKSSHWNTYHRSRFKRLEEVKPSQYSFKSDPSAKPDKSGTYLNPFCFTNYQKAVVIQKDRPKKHYPENTYDNYLHYQNTMANYIVAQLKERHLPLKANCDNAYPSVLIDFPKPSKAKSVDWVNFVIVHYMAICLKLTNERGLNCEIVRRSSFGHLRPSVAETAPSMRINVGVIPKDYADVLVDAAELTHQLLGMTAESNFARPLALPELSQAMDDYNKAGKKSRGNVEIKLPANLWQALWSAMDRKGHSLVYQLMRKEINVEAMINHILDKMLASELNAEKILASPLLIQETFVTPWIDVLKAYRLNEKNQMSISWRTSQLPSYKWQQEPVLIKDEAFFPFVQGLFTVFDHPRILDTKIQTLQNLHGELETASQTLFFNPPHQLHEDGYGSDSDTEGTISLARERTIIYAKKFITATGMRSIQLAFAAIKRHLGEQTQLNFRNLGFNTQYMYYETKEALQKHAIPIVLHNINELAQPLEVVLYDLNHCNTSHQKTAPVTEVVKDSSTICILDTTSATNSLVAESIKELMTKNPHLSTIILVSSGIKNEQAGSDINPYGTIRIFSRNKSERDGLYKQLASLEAEAGYKHPKTSHLLRKTAKERRMTPTNEGILSQMRIA
jgi:hypothetical protein